MERWASKVISLVISFVLPLFFTVLPYFLSGCIARRGRQGARVLSYLLCFGGGIFLGTYLIHISPEMKALVSEYLLDPNGITYPVAEVIVGCGFFFVLLIEKIVTRVRKKRTGNKNGACQSGGCGDQHNHQHQHQDHHHHMDDLSASSRSASASVDTFPSSRSASTSVDTLQDGDGSRNVTLLAARPVSDFVYELPVSDCSCLETEVRTGVGSTSGNSIPDVANGPEVNSKKNKKPNRLTNETGNGDEDRKPEVDLENGMDSKASGKSLDPDAGKQHAEPHTHAHGIDDESSGHVVRSLILILALSLHHIFEGISIGLQHNLQRVFTLIGAVMCHEVIISFSLGMQLTRCNYTFRRLLLTSIVYALFLPVGVAIGTAMMETTADATDNQNPGYRHIQLANGILQAFAAGNFIYVTFFEILQEEITPHDSAIGKVLVAFLGFCVMALLQLVPEEEGGPGLETTTASIIDNYTTLVNNHNYTH